MIVDRQQREEALDCTRSFIVEAPAGSGKTGLLVQRFLRLLSVVERPESVVAVTFTRKAASELKERVVKALAEVSEGALETSDEFKRKTRSLASGVMEQDRRKEWRLLSDPGRLQIMTIDSLCALLTRQMPILSEFGGIGQVVEEASELYLKAARETLVNLAEGGHEDKELFRRVVLHFDNNVPMLERQLITMLGKRDQWEHLAPTSEAQLVDDCCRLLKLAEVQLRLVFQRAGKVDFTEIARAARRALGKPEQPSDLLYSLDYRLQHLLVDEFQDTSRTQYELLKALTEQWSFGDDHTLFVVGDPMQSIYRFREADVSIFLQCWREERIGAVRLSQLTLLTNFRTTPNVLDWVQNQFGSMMTEDNIVEGAVQFRKSFSGRDTVGLKPQLTAHINDKDGREEASEIVSIIRRNPDRQIAILVRSRPQTTHILPALRRSGIAYDAVDIEVLRDQQYIIDVLSLARAITNLADRVSWLACLRAPWCGLSLADLTALAEGKREQTILGLLSDGEIIASLSVDGRWRAVRVQEILADAVTRVGRLPLRVLVEQTWQRLGGLAIIQEPNLREDVDTVFSLIEEADEGGIIRDFSLLNRRLEFLYARPSAKNAKVIVMPVHQAKGLEFDIVILPRLGKMTRNNENELILWAMDGPDLAIAAMPQSGEKDAHYELVKSIHDRKESHETKRLFYVACTRAMNELYLIGSMATKKGGGLSTPRTGTFLRFLWDTPEGREAFESRLRTHVFGSAPTGGASSPRSVRNRLPLDWRAPVLSKSLPSDSSVRRAVASQRPVSYRWVSDAGRHVGTIVHELMRRIAAEGLAAWPETRITSLKSTVGSELLRLGVMADEKRIATDQVLRALLNAIRSERGRWILSPHTRARSEWAIAGRINDVLITGTVDRSFVDEEGICWVIDFKNSDHLGAGRQRFLAAEKARYQPQLEQYAAVIAGLVDAPIRLGLYFPLLDEWLAWQFTEAAVGTN